MPGELLGVTLIDWEERDVYLAPDGRQYLFGPDGGRVYGQWIHPCFFRADDLPEPVIVDARTDQGGTEPLARMAGALDAT